MAKKNLKIPPQHIEAEQSVLGALLLDSKAMFNVADVLRPEDFYSPAHGKIYEATLKLYEKHQPIDILSVTTRLKEDGMLTDVGGNTYLAKLIESVPTAFHAAHYAKIVKEKKIRRDLIHIAAEVGDAAFNEAGELDETLDEIEKKIFAVSEHSIEQRFTHVKNELQAAYERMEKLTQGENELRGVPSGFAELDAMLSGFQKSDLSIIGARPSLGKTSLAMDICRHAAIRHGKSVGVFSLEMSRDQVIDRLISAEANVPLWNLRNGRIKEEADFEAIQAALDRLSHSAIFIDDTPSPNILQMRSMARRLQSEHGLDVLIVDYLQLIQPRTNSDNLVQQITEVSRGLKSLARELSIPVIALSQLSRAVDHRDNKVPRLADLRESGSIEQDADVVMFIYRKDRDKTNLGVEEQNVAEIIIAKHRNGPLGTVKLYFDADKASFRPLDTRHNPTTLA